MARVGHRGDKTLRIETQRRSKHRPVGRRGKGLSKQQTARALPEISVDRASGNRHQSPARHRTNSSEPADGPRRSKLAARHGKAQESNSPKKEYEIALW